MSARTDQDAYDQAFIAPTVQVSDNVSWMPFCVVQCDMCGEMTNQAVHLCEVVGMCINLCTPCVAKISDAVLGESA